jgi:Spy/CpxP family protein refolding chaperone
VKRWWVVILLLLSVGLNIGLLAQRGRERNERDARREARQAEERKDPAGAESREARNRQRMKRLLDRMVEEVGVAGEQRDQFVAIQEGFFDRTLATRQRLRQGQRALRDNLSSPQPDRALAEKQAAEIAEAQKEIEAAFIDNFFATSAILDQDQQHRYRSLVAELRRLRWDRGRRHDERSPEERRHRRDQLEDRNSAAAQDPARD